MEILAARVGTASDERTTAVLSFARKLVANLGRVPPEDIAEAKAASLGDAEIVEITAAVAINLFTNYLNLAADTEIDFPPVAKLAGAA
jgi:alkylhydroperoxidase family enzyme